MKLIGLTLALVVWAAPAFAGSDRAGELDRLYARLAATHFPDEAAGIVSEIERVRLQSGSDVADLLLARASLAQQKEQWPVALPLYDSLVDLYPDFAAAWGERASARYRAGDRLGAVADLGQALKRDPRDIAALSSFGEVMLAQGEAIQALQVYDRALALAPLFEPLKVARMRAQGQVWSQSP